MKKKSKIVSILLGLTLLCGTAFGCGGNGNDDPAPPDDPTPPTPSAPTDEYKEVNYTPAHSSKTRFVHYASANAALDAFMNEYAERHMRDNAQTRIGDASVGGTTRAAWREWDSLIGGWWDASNANGTMTKTYATNDAVNEWLKLDETVGVNFPSYRSIADNQGYIWGDVTRSLASWGMGWDFPDYRKGGKAWDFAGKSELNDWTVSNTDDVTAEITASRLKLTTKNAVSALQIETDDFSVPPAYSPFLRLGFSFETTAEGMDIDDLYVQWTTTDSPHYTADKTVKFSDFCTRGYSLHDAVAQTKKAEQKDYAFPMYLCDKWGADFSGNREITGLRITLKGNKPFRGTLSFDFIASDYDDRQPLNNCNYILAAKNNLEFSRDKELLQTVLPNARKAMNFLYYTLGGHTGLISTEYLVGHRNDGSHAHGTGIGNGYWDVDAFPTVNLYCNLSYYNAIVAMQYLESLADYYDIKFGEVKTANANMNGFDTYTAEMKANLGTLAQTCKRRIQTEFWNEETGRFHVGKYDGYTHVQDHGYIMFNEQAIAAGIATEQQKASILSWINGERTVKGDDSTGKDIYYYELAPRFNTQNIQPDFVWLYDCGWNGNVQNGGTALHVSYYDVVAQSKGNVAKAYERMTALQKWFAKVKAAGGEGKYFYRAYYDTTDIPVQGNVDGHDVNGLIGVDCEFMEAALLMRAVPDAFFGLSTQASGTLCLSPNMPDDLDWWRLENLTFAGYYYDVAVGKYFAQISGVSEYAADSGQEAQLSVSFPIPSFDYAVYVNGKKTSAYSKKDGVIRVVLPFGNAKVEIRNGGV